MKLLVPTAQDMRLLGVRLAGLVRAGDLLLLTGDLGAGKTTLTQGIAAGLGTPGPVLSPTFVVARLHRGGRLPLLHVDAYRLADLSEVDDLDLDADIAESLTVVEWGEGRAEQLAQDRLELRIERRDTDELRTVDVGPVGNRWAPITSADLIADAVAVDRPDSALGTGPPAGQDQAIGDSFLEVGDEPVGREHPGGVGAAPSRRPGGRPR